MEQEINDPAKKNWYIFRNKNTKVCTDPHWGHVIDNRVYEKVCGPLTKAEASECWRKNCDGDSK